MDETQGEGDVTGPEGIYSNVRSDINLAHTLVTVADLEDYVMKKKADMTYFNNEYKVQLLLTIAYVCMHVCMACTCLFRL